MNEEIETVVEDTTENTENVETVEEITTEDKGIELTDTPEDEKKEDGEKPVGRYVTDEELHQMINEATDKRIKRKMEKLEREKEKELSKYRDTENVLRSTFNLNENDDVNAKLREYYENEGVKLPDKIIPGLSSREVEILAKAEADEIIEDGISAMEEEANRLASKGYVNLNPKEKVIFTTIAENLTEEKNRKELMKLGANEDLLTSEDFKSFKSQFNSNVPMEKIYSLYTKQNEPDKKLNPLGSMKNSNSKPDKNFISEDEYDKMSREEIRKNMDLIEKSMPKW